VTSSSMPVDQALVIDVHKVRLLDREQPSAVDLQRARRQLHARSSDDPGRVARRLGDLR